jgi:prepilin-type N-terminal cleavage/methylation domain-containing protein
MRKRAGFTLLEIIVALGLLTLIAGLTFGTIGGALHARDLLEQDDEVNQSARVAMSRLREDLSLAYLTANTGAINTYQTLFVAQDGDPDRLWFAALSHHRLYRGAREGDQTEITYWTEPDPHTSNALVLLRREAPRIDNAPERDGVIEPLAYKVKAFDVRFLDPTTSEWRKEWDTTGADTPNRLPRAAEVTLTLLAPDPDDADDTVEKTYLSTVMLAFGPHIVRSALSNSGSGS